MRQLDKPFTPGAAVRRLRGLSCVTRVLLVEDDTFNLQALTIYLKLMGVEVEQARNGYEALQQLDRNTFDVVVSDIMMPGINGFDLTKRVHQRRPGVPVVLMTGDPTAPPVSALNESEAVDFLVKPFLPRELMKRISRAVGEREL